MIEYSKLKVALEYLDAAIEEREVHQRYFAAMNLAGVSEELLGKYIRAMGGKDQLTDVVEKLSELQEKLDGLIDLGFTNRKELKKLLGSSKNGIKHMDNGSDLNANLYFEIETESKWLIRAAIRNLDFLEIPHSKTVAEFSAKYPEGSD
jgi:hypothetical protein